MERIKIADATPAQLREFGTNSLGLELHGRETTAMMTAKFAAVGYNVDDIGLQEATVVPSGGPNGDVAFNIRDVRADGIKEIRILIHTQDKPGGEDPVQVGVNGKLMLIPRGEPQWVPESYVGVLNNAVEYVYDEYQGGTGNLGGLSKPREVKSYPFSYA